MPDSEIGNPTMSQLVYQSLLPLLMPQLTQMAPRGAPAQGSPPAFDPSKSIMPSAFGAGGQGVGGALGQLMSLFGGPGGQGGGGPLGSLGSLFGSGSSSSAAGAGTLTDLLPLMGDSGADASAAEMMPLLFMG